MRHLPRTMILCACVFILSATPALRGDVEQQTFEAAVFLLRESMEPSRDGRHNIMLRALRHLEDPLLEPFFAELVTMRDTTFKVHGLLGLAEIHPDKKLDLVRLASISQPAEQAQVVSAAMDSKMLSDEQATDILNWPGLETSIKMLVAAQLVQAKQFDRPELLLDALESDNIARQYLARMLLAQIGDAEALARMDDLSRSDTPERDAVRLMLLTTALRFEFDCMGPWALRVATEPGINRQLSLLALKTALRFHVPGAEAMWTQRFTSTTDLAEKTRLALVALQLSPWLDGKFFDVLTREDDALLNDIGRAGAAVATKQNVAAVVTALVGRNFGPTNRWAMSYAMHEATKDDTATIFTAYIEAYQQAPDQRADERIDEVVSVTQLFFDAEPDRATKLLRPILADPKSQPRLIQAILLGLVRCREDNPMRVIEGLGPFKNHDAEQLALLVQARYGQGMSPDALHDLGLMVRGGGIRKDALRVQAAWLYLRITNQVDSALAQVLGQ
jgi:hypothetical protein